MKTLQEKPKKRISLEIAVDEERGDPLATMNLIVYPPAEQMHHFCSFSSHQGFGLRSSCEEEELPLGRLLYNEEVEAIESVVSREDQMQKEQKYFESFMGNKEGLLYRFAHLHYDLAFSSIQKLFGKENELHEVSRSREKWQGYDLEETILAFYIARHCAPLCGKVFDVPYQTVYKRLQEYWKNAYSKAKKELPELVNHTSELIRNGGIALNLLMMERAAERIDGFNRAELQEFKEKYGKK